MVWQIILTAIFYLWLFSALGLLWRIWRDSTTRIRKLEQTLMEATLKASEAAQQAAKAASILAYERKGNNDA